MGFIAKILSAVRSTNRGYKTVDVKTAGKGGANITANMVAPPGYDALPLDGDFCYVAEGQKNGEGIVTGTADNSTKYAEKGESRIYARLPNGTVICEIWLKADGSINAKNALGFFTLGMDGSFSAGNPAGGISIIGGLISGTNENGSFSMAENGTYTVNDVTIQAGGRIICDSIEIGGIEFSAHTHKYDRPLGSHAESDTGTPEVPA